MSDIMALVLLLYRTISHLLRYLNGTILDILQQGPIPQHVAYFVDKNRQHANKNDVTVAERHSAGATTLKQVSPSKIWQIVLAIGRFE
jgi:undecaprenyl pyrophosphate synthase